MQGWIKDYRKELESDIWKMPPLYHRTWQWLKYIANHADHMIPMREGGPMLIQRGQHLSSIREVAKAIGWYEGRKWKEPNPKTISSILDWMNKNGMITIERGKGNKQYTLITLANYEEHQAAEVQGNRKVTPDGEVSTQPMDINKNEKNYENDQDYKIYISLPTDDDYLKIYNSHFKNRFKKDHMPVTEQQLAHIMSSIEELISYDIDQESFSAAVREHFENLPEGNNGNILAFIHAFPRYFEINNYNYNP